ncbi:MAG TPA: glycosyltransferase family 9 protein [Syntrophales bacterium]|nr:glycosyltransferase family 9 protein [Syntrophales bacterium]
MRPEFYEDKWARLRERPSAAELKPLARQLALSFLDEYFYNDRYEAGYIRLLCEMATAFEDDALNLSGAGALFGIVIESLCDDFEELQTETYNRVMCQVVTHCRALPAGAWLDRRLKEFGMDSYGSLFGRIETFRNHSDAYRPDIRPPKKILLLSRVTIGADVAITSVMIQRLKRTFPEAEIRVIGGAKLDQIFGGNPDVHIDVFNYSRRGGLFERFRGWEAVLEAIGREAPPDLAREVILVDPDSRLSQLGVLPLIGDGHYLFFNSRGKDSYPKKMSISELTNHWLDRVFGEAEFCYPRVWLQKDDLDRAARFVAGLRAAGCGRVIAINLGVGGNSRKRLSEAFERRLISTLLEDPRTVILLDKGFGEEELGRTARLMAAFGDRPRLDVPFAGLPDRGIPGGLVGVECDIGEIAALISHSDEFIGYDSACQHIAAAVGVPTYTVFAGSNNTRFIRRWHACGPARSEIIHVDTLTHPPMFDDEDIVARIIDARRG